MFFKKITDWVANLKVSKNTAWSCVFIGGFLEMFWVSGLKYSTNWWQYGLTSLVILISFCLVVLALKKIEVGVAYSVFVGLGAAGIVLTEIIIFGEEVSWIKITLIALLLGGVLGLKFSEEKEGESKKSQESESKASQNLAATTSTATLSSNNGGVK